jgi:hypothetical protein
MSKDTVTILDVEGGDEAVALTQGWWNGQGDPLYAIGSRDGIDIERWVVERAVSNLSADIRKVKRLGHGKYQLGKGTFTKKEIDELHTMRDAFERALAQ